MNPLIVGLAILWFFNRKTPSTTSPTLPKHASSPVPDPGTWSLWGNVLNDPWYQTAVQPQDYRLYRGVCMNIDAIVHNYMVENPSMAWTDGEFNGAMTGRVIVLKDNYLRTLPACIPEPVIYTARTP
jgi:hypothetical protein